MSIGKGKALAIVANKDGNVLHVNTELLLRRKVIIALGIDYRRWFILWLFFCLYFFSHTKLIISCSRQAPKAPGPGRSVLKNGSVNARDLTRIYGQFALTKTFPYKFRTFIRLFLRTAGTYVTKSGPGLFWSHILLGKLLIKFLSNKFWVMRLQLLIIL